MIEGKRVVLRPVEEEDFPLILRWQNHPEVWWYMDYERLFALGDIRENEERARSEGYPFVIAVNGRPIGRIGLNGFRRRDRICSLYLYIGEPAFWGKGYARDAVMTLLRHGFDRFDLHQVELWTLAPNDRVIRVYERCGFQREATLRDRSFKDGTFVDRVVMSVTREEFAEAQLKYMAEDS
jgi:RimJ/RimL family protein N-acetyltransferase